ncbi:MAG: hypothetical protein HQL57_01990 [Magnetococcales bacterium]|nr:hypothetical protein [Magnetococcales bacterium]MBF0155939.1 hypothetical protein [Magnetococcales bacterium]
MLFLKGRSGKKQETKGSSALAIPTPPLAGMEYAEIPDIPDPVPISTIHKQLTMLVQEAKCERMEFALPLIESLRMTLALDHATGATPPGTLTAKSWLGLLNQWENQLTQLPERQRRFSKSFFRDLASRLEKEASPLFPILLELVEMLEMASPGGLVVRN